MKYTHYLLLILLAGTFCIRPVSGYGARAVIVPMTKYSPGVETVTSAGRVWMDRNLGAQRQALNLRDINAYGSYFQWGRGNDGHAYEGSSTNPDLSDRDDPRHGDFITTTPEPYVWRWPQNHNLWQGITGINNPCPSGFRVPTMYEWEIEFRSWGGTSEHQIFSSPLKVTLNGLRNHDNGSYSEQGSRGYYWSSTTNGDYSASIAIIPGLVVVPDNAFMLVRFDRRANGISLRCIKD